MTIEYSVKLVAEPGYDLFYAELPSWPLIATTGTDKAHALNEIRDALDEGVAWSIKNGQQLPPSKLVRGAPTIRPSVYLELKYHLTRAFSDSGMNKSALAKRLGISEVQVRRMLDPKHRSEVGSLIRALGVLGKSVRVEVFDAA